MGRHFRRNLLAFAVGLALLAAGGRPAVAQFSPDEGYDADGRYRVQAEIVPYIWLPATDAKVGLAHPEGYTVSISTPAPTISKITSVVDAALIGAGLVRYGPWSAEFDMQWINANQSRSRTIDNTGIMVQLNEQAALFRIAPGFGYEVLRGDVLGIPASLDLRAGFSYFAVGASANPANLAVHGLSSNSDFVQPWLGLRADFYPTPDWRIELGGLGQGLGVSGGSWGWGASFLVSYLITSWLDVTAGFRALNSSRNFGSKTNGRSTSPPTAAF